MNRLEELRARVKEIQERLTELDRQFAGEAFPGDAREEWETISEERDTALRTIEEVEARQDQLAALATEPDAHERGASFQTGRPGVARGEDIFDLTTIRSSFSNPDAARSELHDRCKRAIESAVMPYGFGLSMEESREGVERLLDIDNEQGELGRRILHTGSPLYRRAFRKKISGAQMTSDEERSIGIGSTGFPLPWVLDPTVMPVSASVVNPLRAISRVVQIVGANEWRGVTAAAITAGRAAEAAEAGDNTPTLAQPAIVCSRVQAFVPFSVESEGDWPAMDAELGRLFSDAKDDEEATSFLTGNGTPPQPFGLQTGVTGTTPASTGLTITAANLYSLEGALAPRFRPRAQIVANRAMYNIIRALDTAGGAQLWLRIGELIPNNPRSDGGLGNTGLRLVGYPVNELSTMSATVVNATKIMYLGDFSMFVIVDRVGMNVELIPQVFGASQRPTGQRGLYAWWRNGSKVIDPVAFRALTGTT